MIKHLGEKEQPALCFSHMHILHNWFSFCALRKTALWGWVLGRTCLPPCKHNSLHVRAGWESACSRIWGAAKPFGGSHISFRSCKASPLRSLLFFAKFSWPLLLLRDPFQRVLQSLLFFVYIGYKTLMERFRTVP